MSAVGPSVTDGATESVRVPTLTVSVTPVLSYALAHNRIAVVHRVDIGNPGPDVGRRHCGSRSRTPPVRSVPPPISWWICGPAGRPRSPSRACGWTRRRWPGSTSNDPAASGSACWSTAPSSPNTSNRCRSWRRDNGWRCPNCWAWRCWPPSSCRITRRSTACSPTPCRACCSSAPGTRRMQGYQAGPERVDETVQSDLRGDAGHGRSGT